MGSCEEEKYLSISKQVVTKVSQLLFNPYLSFLISFRFDFSYSRYLLHFGSVYIPVGHGSGNQLKDTLDCVF